MDTIPFPFIQTPRVILAHGASTRLADELALLGVRRPLLLSDAGLARLGVVATVQAHLPPARAGVLHAEVPENPTTDSVAIAAGIYHANGCDGVVALGGGSVIDTAKAVALLALHPGPLSHYLNQPGNITAAVAPLIAMPTTAGTGSEASHASGIHPTTTSRAQGLASPHLVPRVAICDPDLTLTLPPHLTAATGLDALSHCIESYLATPNQPLVDAIALDGIRRVVNWVELAVADGSSREARWHMMLAALQGGMAIPKGLGPVHAVAGTLGDQGLHHGLLVALAMPPVLRLTARHAPERMARLAEALGVPTGADVAEAIFALHARLELPANLRAAGYQPGDLDEIAQTISTSRFNTTAPWQPSAVECRAIVTEMLG